ncbi:hypothetical protein ACIFOT_21445 [Neobacillus sp. NRS-1170]|uniref:hypothetical protein n=1 Tax=Neobacillus sp. NRS-1170 TaxID=3233898 RepID=UPI003D2B8F55
MTYASFLRFTGWCAIISGILTVSLAIWYNTSMEAFGSYVDLISMLFLALGLVGLYLRQAKEFGIFGFIIFLLVFFGSIMWAGHGWTVSFLVPSIEDSAPAILDDPSDLLNTGVALSLYPFFIGVLLFGLWTAIKGVLPRTPAILLVIVPILDFFPFGSYVAQPLAGIAILWLGYSLLKGASQEETN